jgi:DNA topoisomerase IB
VCKEVVEKLKEGKITGEEARRIIEERFGPESLKKLADEVKTLLKRSGQVQE